MSKISALKKSGVLTLFFGICLSLNSNFTSARDRSKPSKNFLEFSATPAFVLGTKDTNGTAVDYRVQIGDPELDIGSLKVGGINSSEVGRNFASLEVAPLRTKWLLSELGTELELRFVPASGEFDSFAYRDLKSGRVHMLWTPGVAATLKNKNPRLDPTFVRVQIAPALGREEYFDSINTTPDPLAEIPMEENENMNDEADAEPKDIDEKPQGFVGLKASVDFNVPVQNINDQNDIQAGGEIAILADLKSGEFDRASVSGYLRWVGRINNSLLMLGPKIEAYSYDVKATEDPSLIGTEERPGRPAFMTGVQAIFSP